MAFFNSPIGGDGLQEEHELPEDLNGRIKLHHAITLADSNSTASTGCQCPTVFDQARWRLYAKVYRWPQIGTVVESSRKRSRRFSPSF